MAYLRPHKRSPFWYLKRRSLDTGHWGEKSTGLRIDSARDTRKAQRAADKASIEEKRVGSPGTSPAFLAWVPPYMENHWTREGGSRRRYQIAWQAVRRFLAEHDIAYPRQVRYEHAEAYLSWRRATAVHNKSVGRNTAILELNFLSQLLNEAKRRDFCESNPMIQLGLEREPAKEKRELTFSEITKLRKALKREPQWMRNVFEIALYTGCRFSEASIPVSEIDFRARTIRLRDSKRKDTDRRKFFTVPMAPGLRPLLLRIKQTGAATTCELSRDKNGRINYLFKKTIGDASFHCLRVTFITWCARAGLSEAEAMRLVNHSSQIVHRIYSKLNVEDVRRAQRKIRFPKAAPAR